MKLKVHQPTCLLVLPLTAPCQNVLDFFKTVLRHYNQFVQPQPEEQLTEVSLTKTFQCC